MADAPLTSNTTNLPFINLAEQSADPAAPAAGRVALYVKSGSVYVRRSTGDPAAAGGVPALAQGRLAIGDGSNTLSALALGTSGQVVTADASGYATWAAAAGGGGGGGAGHLLIPCLSYSGSVGGTPVVSVSTSQPLGFYMARGSAALNDQLAYKLALDAGTYTLRLLYVMAANSAICTLALDGASIGTIDLYASGNSFNHTSDIAGITVSSAGLKTLTLTGATKNASSTGYTQLVTSVSLWRTA